MPAQAAPLLGQSHGKRYRGYECGRDQHSNQTTILCPASVAIRQSSAEESMLRWLHRNAQGEDDFAREHQQQRQQEKAGADTIDAHIIHLMALRKRLLDTFLDAEGDAEVLRTEFREKRQEITTEITMLTAKATELRSAATMTPLPPKEAFTALVTMWSRTDESKVNDALRSMVSRVYVHRANVQRRDLTGRLEVIGLWADDPHQQPHAIGPRAKL